MCRLFGLYANRFVDVYFSFYVTPKGSFITQSHGNPDGWGIAWLDDESWHIFKEPLALYKSGRAMELIRRIIQGKIIVSHVRLASTGVPRLENTHPWLYKGWVFAHNGTISKLDLLRFLREDYRAGLEGDTDSEVFFHLIVQEANEVGDPIEGIRGAISKIVGNNIGFSSLNFIASDGERLYALRYARSHLDYYTLYYIERPCEGLELRRLSKETRQLISMKLASGEKAVIVASEIMSNEPYWRLIPNKHLALIDRDLNVELIRI